MGRLFKFRKLRALIVDNGSNPRRVGSNRRLHHRKFRRRLTTYLNLSPTRSQGLGFGRLAVPSWAYLAMGSLHHQKSKPTLR